MIGSRTVPLRTSINFPNSTYTDIWSKINMSSYRCCTNVEPIRIQRSQFVCFRGFDDFYKFWDFEF